MALIPTLTLTRYTAGNLLSLSATGCLVGPAPDSLAPCPQVRGHLPALTLTTDHGPNPNLIPTLTLTRYMAGNLLSLSATGCLVGPAPDSLAPARPLPFPSPPPAAQARRSSPAAAVATALERLARLAR